MPFLSAPTSASRFSFWIALSCDSAACQHFCRLPCLINIGLILPCHSLIVEVGIISYRPGFANVWGMLIKRRNSPTPTNHCQELNGTICWGQYYFYIASYSYFVWQVYWESNTAAYHCLLYTLKVTLNNGSESKLIRGYSEIRGSCFIEGIPANI